MELFDIKLDKNSDIPIYMQLYNYIKNTIEDGTLKSGSKLPPIRKLASSLGVNNSTVVNAYKELEIKKLVNAVKGSGYYVADNNMNNLDDNINLTDDDYQDKFKLMASGQIEITASTINFASATPDPSIFPFKAFKSVLNEVLDRDKGYAFGYQESNGYGPLRASLCDYFLRECGISASPDDIQIVSGAQQGIDIIGKTLLKSGDYVITENPTYTGASAVFKSRGANLIGIPLEHDGINIKLLEENIIKYKPKLIYLMTHFQNPTTITYSVTKLKQVLQLAEKYDIYIVEDDSLSGLSYDNTIHNDTLKSLDTCDRVIYIKSFSKLLMPGLRIGFIVTPQKLMEGILAAKHSTDISSSGLIQRALQLYFQNGHWEEHLNYMKSIYRKKYELTIDALKELKRLGVTYDDPRGGLNLWLKLPKSVSANALYEECAKRDVLIVPCSVFYINKNSDKDNAVRISYAATNETEIKEGIKIISDCLRRLINTPNRHSFITPLI